jgi:hypothetical protein
MLLQMYIPQNWEFGPAFLKTSEFRGGLNPPNYPPGYASEPRLSWHIGSLRATLFTSDVVVQSNLGSVSMMENITTIVSTVQIKLTRLKTAATEDGQFNIIMRAIYGLGMNDWLHGMCSSISHNLYLIDLFSPLKKSEKERSKHLRWDL